MRHRPAVQRIAQNNRLRLAELRRYWTVHFIRPLIVNVVTGPNRLCSNTTFTVESFSRRNINNAVAVSIAFEEFTVQCNIAVWWLFNRALAVKPQEKISLTYPWLIGGQTSGTPARIYHQCNRRRFIRV